MTDPITPPPELVYDWARDRELLNDKTPFPEYIATCAAQWGADQELEACCEWMHSHRLPSLSDRADDLRAARRPEPENLNSIALKMLYTIERMDIVIPEITGTIRRALEELSVSGVADRLIRETQQ